MSIPDVDAMQEVDRRRALSLRSDRLRSLGEMAAGIAHELNQPLVSVRGAAEHVLIEMEEGWELSPERAERETEPDHRAGGPDGPRHRARWKTRASGFGKRIWNASYLGPENSRD